MHLYPHAEVLFAGKTFFEGSGESRMSASQDKKRRSDERVLGTERRQVASQKEAKERKQSKIKWTVGTVIVVLLVVAILLGNSSLFYTARPALQVGDVKYSSAEVNYAYRTAYLSFCNQYSSILSSIGFDTKKPLDEQKCTISEEFDTWDDYFKNAAKQNLVQVTALCDAAEKAGITLDEDDQHEVDEQFSYIELSAKQYKYSSVSKYLQAVYGNGVTKKVARHMLELSQLASKYSQQQYDSYTYTDEQIASEYAADPNSYDAVTYRQFLVSDAMFQTDSTDTEDDDAEAEAETLSDEELTALKEELASKMAADTQGDEQAFIDQAYENCLESAKETYAEDSATLKENQLYSSLSTDVADWLFDAGRAEGDTTYIATDSVYYVLYFVSRSTNDYQLPNVRHILFSVSDTTDETAMDEARTKAEDVLTEYEAGDKTAESFGELAKEYTSDSNGDEGGLYENIMPGQMVTEFNDWCFDADRKPGDTGIIETSYGVHVMYFDSFGKIYRDALVENALRSADYNAWYDATAGDGSYTTSAFGMKYTTK